MNYKNMLIGSLVSVGVLIAVKKFAPSSITRYL